MAFRIIPEDLSQQQICDEGKTMKESAGIFSMMINTMASKTYFLPSSGSWGFQLQDQETGLHNRE
jgi:hypothetical protein